MIRIRAIVVTCLTVGISSASIALSSPAQASEGLATTFTTNSSATGDGYQATFTITNGTSKAVGAWSVAVILPAGASVSNLTGANIVVHGQLVTASNAAGQGRLAPGATATFGFSVHGGTAPPSACMTNGVPCQPVASPSGSPTPSATATPSPSAKPSQAPPSSAPPTPSANPTSPPSSSAPPPPPTTPPSPSPSASS